MTGLDAAWGAVEHGYDERAFAGAVALLGRNENVLLHRSIGMAVAEPFQVPMRSDAIFDLASLTKVVATLPSILQLVDDGALALDKPVGMILPSFGIDGWKRQVTVRRVLSHCAGLPAWAPMFLDARGASGYLAAIAAVEPAYEPGSRVVYSDLDFILLGEVVRAVSGQNIARFARRNVFDRIGMVDTGYLPVPTLIDRIVATEIGNPYEMGTCGDRAAEFGGWRTGLIRGEVHDGNAFYGLQGISWHAGLFGTAVDLLRYGRCWLNLGRYEGSRLISESLVREAVREQAPGRGLGWALPDLDPAADPLDLGQPFGIGSFGHTGFTGTSLWVDPKRDLVVVLLTNRVHPVVTDKIRSVRRRFHEAIAEAIEARPHDITERG